MQGRKFKKKEVEARPGTIKKKDVSKGSQMNKLQLTIAILYVLAELVPRFNAVDVMGGQWLYLAILNCITTAYLLRKKIFLPNRLFKTALFFLYFGFILLSGLSFFVAYNIIESLVTYSRLIITFIAFLNILSLIYHDNNILKPLILAAGILVLYQSMEVLIAFFTNFPRAKSLEALINDIKGNTGNKNILAASMVIKIPFLIYAVHRVKMTARIFYAVVLLLGFVALLIVNARSSYVGLFLELIIYFVLAGVFFFKSGRKRSSLKIPGLVTAVFVASVLITQLLFSSFEKNKPSSSYGGLAKRVESINLSNEASSGRLVLWNNAIDFIKRNPVLGGGFGNWKIYSCNYERFWQPGFGAFMAHVHNDFLEVITDTGVFGGILYAGIFLVLFWYIFLFIKSPEVSFEKKLIVAAGGMSLAAFTVDSFFNFPLERANVQVLFALSSSLIVFGYLDFKKPASDDSYSYYKKGIWLSIALAFGSLYVAYNVFKSMRIQDKIAVEWIGLPRQARVPFKADDVNPYIPSIPNINGSGMPMACVKAKYLCQENRFDEALALLNNDKGSNPYIYFAEYLKSMIALSLQQPDTAYYYAKYAYYNRPANLQLYDYLSGLAVDRKDSAELTKCFREVAKRYSRPDQYAKYIQNIYYITGNEVARNMAIETGLKRYPGDPAILYQKYFLEGLNDFKVQSYPSAIEKFREALKYKAGDHFAEQNIGYAYLNLGLYSEAVPFFSDVINQKVSNDGKNEYFRGVCYQNLDKKDSACFDFLYANSMGYPLNPLLIQGCR